MKMVDETPVYVMKGEYEYPGADGQMWKVKIQHLANFEILTRQNFK